MTEQTQAMYLTALVEIPEVVLDRALRPLLIHCKFMPTIAEIWEEVSRAECQLQNEREALRQSRTRLVEDKTKQERYDGKTREALKAEFEEMLLQSKSKNRMP